MGMSSDGFTSYGVAVVPWPTSNPTMRTLNILPSVRWVMVTFMVTENSLLEMLKYTVAFRNELVSLCSIFNVTRESPSFPMRPSEK